MASTIKIGDYELGNGKKPMVVAELSGNHNGSLDRALALISEAKKAGADAVKFQTYTPETMTIQSTKPDFKIKGGLWDGQTLYELYQWAHTPLEWHKALFAKANEEKILAFSSPFDESAVDLLESLRVPAYKIASFEMTDLPLVEKVANTGKPMVISTGMASLNEIIETVECAQSCGNKQLILLHCVSAYPADYREYNLNTLNDLAKRLQIQVGLSDHTLDNTTAITSVGLGACFIEKHFTMNREEGGPDSAFSLQPNELESLCKSVEIAWASLGKVFYGQTEGEKESSIFRRSLYVVKDIGKGEIFTEQNVRRIRPGYGLAPKYYRQILGQKAITQIERGTALRDSMIEGFERSDV